MPQREISAKFRPVGLRSPLNRREIASLHRVPVEEGAGEVPPEAEKGRRGTLGRPAVHLYQRPDWVSELAHRGVSVSEMLEEVHKRVLDDPHEETLVAAQMVVNDIARLPEGQELLQRFVTADLITQLIPTEGKR